MEVLARSDLVDVDAIPILYLVLSSTRAALMRNSGLVWPAVGLMLVMWFFGVFGKIRGLIVDTLYYRREVKGA